MFKNESHLTHNIIKGCKTNLRDNSHTTILLTTIQIRHSSKKNSYWKYKSKNHKGFKGCNVAWVTNNCFSQGKRNKNLPNQMRVIISHNLKHLQISFIFISSPNCYTNPHNLLAQRYSIFFLFQVFFLFSFKFFFFFTFFFLFQTFSFYQALSNQPFLPNLNTTTHSDINAPKLIR